MGQHISLGPARKGWPYTSAGMLLHPLKPLLVLQHPLKSCCQGPEVRYTFFNPLFTPLTPLGQTSLTREESMLMAAVTCLWGPAEQGNCRQFLQTVPFPCRQPLRFLSCWERNTLYREQRWVACCSWSATERAQPYKSCSVCTITSEQLYTSRKGKTDCFFLLHHFSNRPLKSEDTSGKCLERAVIFNTWWSFQWIHSASPLGHSGMSMPQPRTDGTATKGKCCGNSQTAFSSVSASHAAWVIFVQFPF